MMTRTINAYVLILSAVAICTCASTDAAAKGSGFKAVRVANENTDTAIRVRCVGFDHDTAFTVTLETRSEHVFHRIACGDRGVVVYDSFSEKIIAVGTFVIDPKGRDVLLRINGNAKTGYAIFAEEWDSE